VQGSSTGNEVEHALIHTTDAHSIVMIMIVLQDNLAEEEARILLHELADQVPRDVRRLLDPPQLPDPTPPFCQCGHCVLQAKPRMNFCCCSNPCISRFQTFSTLPQAVW
jgi:hypothetical protein